MKALVARVIAAHNSANATDKAAVLIECDISGNTELETLYGVEIPVLMVNGRKAAKYRIGEGELRRRLEAEG